MNKPWIRPVSPTAPALSAVDHVARLGAAGYFDISISCLIHNGNLWIFVSSAISSRFHEEACRPCRRAPEHFQPANCRNRSASWKVTWMSACSMRGRRLLPTLAAHTLYNHAVPLLDAWSAREALRSASAGRGHAACPSVSCRRSTPAWCRYCWNAVAGGAAAGGQALRTRAWTSSGACSAVAWTRHRASRRRVSRACIAWRYEDELQLVVPENHPLRDFRKVSLSQAATADAAARRGAASARSGRSNSPCSAAGRRCRRS